MTLRLSFMDHIRISCRSHLLRLWIWIMICFSLFFLGDTMLTDYENIAFIQNKDSLSTFPHPLYQSELGSICIMGRQNP